MVKARVTTVMFNSHEPEKLVHFWSSFLNVKAHPHNESTEHIWLFPTEGENFKLGFQRVTEAVTPTNDVHVDVAVENLDEAQELVLRLGGQHIKTSKMSNGFEWRVLEDSQGNHFCIYRDFDH
ncbi:MAG: hypothetical protein RJB54_183 [Actinomycetota bacterium]|jgi:predicted enzyme related to lactoylglutathione lyase